MENPLTYTAREWDAEVGLYFYRARYYDPVLQRFISEDPIGLAGGLNPYAYVGNDPVNFTDPSGLVPCPASLSLKDQLLLAEQQLCELMLAGIVVNGRENSGTP